MEAARQYRPLVERLMIITEKENPTKRQLRSLAQALDRMRELGNRAREDPKYFNSQGQNLCTLLRHGVKYL